MADAALWTSKELARATGGQCEAEWAVGGVSIDSRTVEAGDLFVALKGPNFDGHAFVKAALDKLGEAPFYVINGDVVWLDGVIPALRRLATSWDPERMDGLLLLHPTITAHGYDGAGDFIMASDGHLRRRLEREVAAFLFAGVQILHPRLFKGAPDGAFSLNLLYDRAIEAERLCGLRHDGEWFHVGTPQALELADELLREEIGDRPASFRRNLAEVKER